MALLIMESKVELPKVPYLTALDIYLEVCFGFVLSSVFEFACVHHYTKFTKEEIRQKEKSLIRRFSTINTMNCVDTTRITEQYNVTAERLSCNITHESDNDEKIHKHKEENLYKNQNLKQQVLAKWSLFSCFKSFYKCSIKFKNKNKIEQYNRVSQIDYLSRIIYPVLFGLFNFIYWNIYIKNR